MEALEHAIRNSPEEITPCEFGVEHFYATGTYMRVLHIPAGHVLTGEIHRNKTVNILAQGKIAIATSQGDKMMEAPAYFVTEPGEKKAGYALEDTIWINVFPCEDNEPVEQILEQVCYMQGYEQLERETRSQLDFFEE